MELEGYQAKDLDTGYTLKASALTGAFYFFKHTNNSTNQPSIPGTIANKTVTAFTHPLAYSIHRTTQGTAKQASAFFSPTSTHIPSTQLPNTSLSIAITDSIRPSKSHRNLMPLLWDLIEATIKGKRELLLPWRDTLALASVAAAALNQSLQHP